MKKMYLLKPNKTYDKISRYTIAKQNSKLFIRINKKLYIKMNPQNYTNLIKDLDYIMIQYCIQQYFPDDDEYVALSQKIIRIKELPLLYNYWLLYKHYNECTNEIIAVTGIELNFEFRMKIIYKNGKVKKVNIGDFMNKYFKNML